MLVPWLWPHAQGWPLQPQLLEWGGLRWGLEAAAPQRVAGRWLPVGFCPPTPDEGLLGSRPSTLRPAGHQRQGVHLQSPPPASQAGRGHRQRRAGEEDGGSDARLHG